MEKTIMLGKVEGKRRRGGQRTRWLDEVARRNHQGGGGRTGTEGDGEGQI